MRSKFPKYLLAFLLTFQFPLTLFLSSCQQQRARDDQGRTSACWIYAMLECIEREAALRGDSVQLSRQWLMAKELQEQTQWMYFKGKENSISLRGVGPEAIRLIKHYGLIPYQNEKNEIVNSRVLERKLALLAEQTRDLESLQEQVKELLPRFTLSPHNAFYYLSMRYNPHQFAESIMYCQHWRFYASVPYHSYGNPFVLEVPDNYNRHEFINLPIDDLTAMVTASLKAGHAVYWETGNRTRDGLTTSNHAMAIVGMKDGKFVCKNSYGKEWGNNGYCLVSIDHFKNHTCNVGILEE
ncbi:MAG: hypothetical protein IJ782_07165 [Prevotella sp.]|nr:hypothetical protein [Prevotella sp.]